LPHSLSSVSAILMKYMYISHLQTMLFTDDAADIAFFENNTKQKYIFDR
jgi:hypothetical protein